MCEQAIRSAVDSLDDNFDMSRLNEMLQEIFTDAPEHSFDEIKNMLSVSADLNTLFPNNNTFKKVEITEESQKNLHDQYLDDMAGFTTPEKKISILTQNDQKAQFMAQNLESLKILNQIHGKILLLSFNFALEQQKIEKETESKNFLEHADEMFRKFQDYDEDQNLKEELYRCSQMLPIPNFQGLTTQNRAEIIQHLSSFLVILRPLEPTPVSKENTALSLYTDFYLKNIIKVLKQIISDSKSDHYEKSLALRTLYRLGRHYARAEFLILVAKLQKEHKIDISDEIRDLFEESEQPTDSLLGGSGSGDQNGEPFNRVDPERVQDRVSYPGSDDRTEKDHLVATDGTHYYTWSFQKGGMSVGLKNQKTHEYGQNSSSVNSSDLNQNTDSICLFSHQGQLYVRSSKFADQPFVKFDKKGHKIENQPQICGELENGKSPLTNYEFESQEKFEEQADKLNEGWRNEMQVKLCSDNEFIYALVAYTKKMGKHDTDYTGSKFEKYSFEDNKLVLQKTWTLKRKNGKDFRASQRHERKSILNCGGHIACNEEFLVYHSTAYIYAFPLSDSVQEIKWTHKHSFDNHITMFDNKSGWFYDMDCSSYSWLHKFKIKDFKVKSSTIKGSKELPKMPVLLSEIKSNIGKYLSEEEKKPAYIENQFSKNILSDDFIQPFSEKLKFPMSKLAQIPTIHEQTESIIMNLIMKYSIAADKRVQIQSQKITDEDKMIQFFKVPNSVYLNKSLFLLNMQEISSKIANFLQKSAKMLIEEQIPLLSLIHLLIANIRSLQVCKMTVKSILSEQEMQQLVSLQSQLAKIDQIKINVPKLEPKQEMPGQIALQLHIKSHSEALGQLLTKSLDFSGTLDKFSELASLISISQKVDADKARISSLVTNLSSIKELYQFFDKFDTESVQQANVTTSFCFISINNAIKELFSDALNKNFEAIDLKQPIDRDFSQFQFNYCTTMIFCYLAFKKKVAKLEEDLQSKEPKEGEKETEEYNKLAAEVKESQEHFLKMEEAMFQTFIIVSEHLKFQMNLLASHIENLDFKGWTQEEVENFGKFLIRIFERKHSIFGSFMNMAFCLSSFKLKQIWVDEVAEALRNSTSSINCAIIACLNNFSCGDHSNENWLKDSNLQTFFGYRLQVLANLMGVISHRLIKIEEKGSSELSKLSILQGGIENRFIPELTEATKQKIEGSFKILNDKQLRKVSMAKKESVILTDQDKLLLDIIDPDPKSPNSLLIDLLQHKLISKVPFCPFARLGQDAGMRLSRAAFAAIVKMTDSVYEFETLVCNVNDLDELVRLDDQKDSDRTRTRDQLKELVNMVQESQDAEVFAQICKRWEQASQMRKWTQTVKMRLGESSQLEVEQKFRDEFELKDEPLSDTQKDDLKKRIDEKFDKDLAKTYDAVIEKAKFILKLKIPAAFIAQKKEKKMRVLQNSLMHKMMAHSAPKSSLKHGQSVMQNMGGGESPRPGFAIQLERKTSQIVHMEDSLKEKDKEFDWRDRLAQWKTVSQAKGAITDMTDQIQKPNSQQSATLTILGVLQVSFESDQIQEAVEQALINGLTRSAGLNLLNFASNLNGNPQIFYDVLQWLQSSLRDNKNKVAHFLDGLSGCGDRIEDGIRAQFFKIIEKIIFKIQLEKDKQKMVHLVEGLAWNYNAQDFEFLIKLRVLDVLRKGDGSIYHDIRRNWGLHKRLLSITGQPPHEENVYSLAARLHQVSLVVQNSVLSHLVAGEMEQVSIDAGDNVDKQVEKLMLKRQDTGSVHNNRDIVKQLFFFLMQMAEYALKVNRMAPPLSSKYNSIIHKTIQENKWNFEEKSSKVEKWDVYFHNSELKSRDDLEKHVSDLQEKSQEKLDLLIKQIKQFEEGNFTFDDKDYFEAIANSFRKHTKIQDTDEIVNLIKQRDLQMLAILQKIPFDELALKSEVKKIEKQEENSKNEKSAEETNEESKGPDAEKAVDEEQKQEEEEKSEEQKQKEKVENEKSEKIAQIIGMGFSIGQAKRALRKTDNNLEQAINFVLEHGNESDSQEDLSNVSKDENKDEPKNENEIPDFFKSDFHTNSLFQILRQLDQIVSLAQKSPQIKNAIISGLEVQYAQILIELLVEPSWSVRFLALKIIQNMLQLKTKVNLFDMAIENCLQINKEEPSPEKAYLHRNLAKCVEEKCTIQIEKSLFVRFLTNQVQVSCRHLGQKSNYFDKGQFQFGAEAMRTLRLLSFLQLDPESTFELHQKLQEALLKIETFKSVQVAEIFSLVAECRLKPRYVGDPCTTQDGTNVTVCEYLDTITDPRNAESQRFVIYNDAKNPSQQQVNKMHQFDLVQNLDSDKRCTLYCAETGVFMNKEIVSHLIDLFASKSSPIAKMNKNLALMLRHYIQKGLQTTLELLQGDFTDLLTEDEDLLSKWIIELASLSGQTPPKDAPKVILPQNEEIMHQICSIINIYDKDEIKADKEGRESALLSKDRQWLLIDRGLTGKDDSKEEQTELHLIAIAETLNISDEDEIQAELISYFDSQFFNNLVKFNDSSTNPGVIDCNFKISLLSSKELQNPTWGSWNIYRYSTCIITDCEDLTNWDSELKLMIHHENLSNEIKPKIIRLSKEDFAGLRNFIDNGCALSDTSSYGYILNQWQKMMGKQMLLGDLSFAFEILSKNKDISSDAFEKELITAAVSNDEELNETELKEKWQAHKDLEKTNKKDQEKSNESKNSEDQSIQEESSELIKIQDFQKVWFFKDKESEEEEEEKEGKEAKESKEQIEMEYDELEDKLRNGLIQEESLQDGEFAYELDIANKFKSSYECDRNKELLMQHSVVQGYILQSARKSLLTLLSQSEDIFGKNQASLFSKPNVYTNLDDMIHNEYEVSWYTSAHNSESKVGAQSEQLTRRVLTYLSNFGSFPSFIVKDFLERATNTMNLIRKNEYQVIVDGTLSRPQKWAKFWQEEMFQEQLKENPKLTILHPANLIFYTKYFIENKYLGKFENKAEILLAIFDVHMAYVLTCHEDALVYLRRQLLYSARQIILAITADDDLLQNNVELIKTKLLQNRFLKQIMTPLRQKTDKDKQALTIALLVEILVVLNGLVRKCKSEFDFDLSVEVGQEKDYDLLIDDVNYVKKGLDVERDLIEFKFNLLLQREKSAFDVRNLGLSYESTLGVQSGPFQTKIQALEKDLCIKFPKYSDDRIMELKVGEDNKVMVSKQNALDTQVTLKKGQVCNITYPVTSISFLSSGIVSEDQFTSDKFEEKQELTSLNPDQVLSACQHTTFVVGNKIWGCGKRVQQDPKLTCFDLPEGVQIKKAFCGKFTRNILTTDNRLFWMGQNRNHNYGQGNASYGSHELQYDGFKEFPLNKFKLKGGEVVEKIDAGKYHFACITSQNRLLFSGKCNDDSGFIQNHKIEQEGYDHLYEIPKNSEERDWQYTEVWCSHKMQMIYVTMMSPDKKKGKTFSFGEHGCDRGYKSNEQTGAWAPLNLPDGIYLTKMSNNWRLQYGIDQNQDLWGWGYRIDECHSSLSSHPGWSGYEDLQKPMHHKWLKEQGYKVLEVSTGQHFGMAKVANKHGELMLLGLGNRTQNFFGATTDYETICDGELKIIKCVDVANMKSFACNYVSTSILIKNEPEKFVSVCPEKPEEAGLIHFYKKDDAWVFVTPDEYQDKKEEIPDLCFATRHAIKDLKEQDFPDLTALDTALKEKGEAQKHPMPTTFEQKEIPANQPFYISPIAQGENKIKTFVASEEQVLQGGQQFDLTPTIFFRIKKPVANVEEILPSFDLLKFFKPAEEAKDMQIRMVVQNESITKEDINEFQLEEEENQILKMAEDLPAEQKNELLIVLDQHLKGQKMDKIKARHIDCSELTLRKESPLKEVNTAVLDIYARQIVQFNKNWLNVVNYVCAEYATEGSISSAVMKSKHLILPVVILDQIDRIVEQLPTGCEGSVSISRRKAQIFADSGRIDHEGKFSIFGQIMHQLIDYDPDFSCFRHKDNEAKFAAIEFKGEGSMDYGGPFRDAVTNCVVEMESGVVPLLLKTPNNKNEHGNYRDCFLLDMRSSGPIHKQMFKFLGAFFGFAFMSQSPLNFNFAPMFWKQLLNEELTLVDLENIDAYSTQVLRDLQQYSSLLSDEEFEASIEQNFTTVLSDGTEVELCEGGSQKQVTKQNLDEFIQLVLKARFSESKPQMDQLREGMNQVLSEQFNKFSILNWLAIEKRICGDKVIDVERLRSITTFPCCKSDHEIVGRFWRTFESFDAEERSQYLKFVWGRTRLPISGLKELRYKHEVRLMENLDKNGFPLAHTCFFQLDIPAYQTDEICRQRLLAAAQLCGEMDTDMTNVVDEVD